MSAKIRCADCNCLPSECAASLSQSSCPNCNRYACCCWEAIHSSPINHRNISAPVLNNELKSRDSDDQGYVSLAGCEECLLCESIVTANNNAVHLLKEHSKEFNDTLTESLGEVEARRVIKAISKLLNF